MFKKIILVSLFFTLGLILFSPVLVQGQGIIPTSTGVNHCPAGYPDQNNCGDYTLNDTIALAINVSRWILGIIGSLTLLMFIYGGFMFLISAGSSDKIGEARKIIMAAVIGLLIVLASFLIIKFVLGSMGLNWTGGQGVTQLPTTSNNLTGSNCTAANPGYSCMDVSNGNSCIAGLCPGNNSIQCCKAN